jgi:2Fe-2S ferredoxin
MSHAIVHGPDGETVLQGGPGDSVMQLARAAGLPVLGECNGSLACATCHVIVDDAWTAKLPPITEAEDAMLDTVFDLMPTSRLSCQLRLTDALDGLRVRLP